MKPRQSLAGYIRERLASYEERLAVGIRQDVIVEELVAAGYETNIYSFRTLLSRARKKRGEGQAISGAKPTAGTSVKPVVEELQQVKKEENSLTKPAGFDAKALKNQQDSDLI